MTMKQLLSSRIHKPEVAAVFRGYPKEARAMLKNLRQHIIEVASASECMGPLEETLKWGEPSYLSSQTKSGSTIRLDWKPKNPDCVAIYFKCTTNLVDTFQKKYPLLFNYGGKRCITFKLGEDIPEKEIRLCIALALTYHLHKKLSAKKRWDFVAGILSIQR